MTDQDFDDEFFDSGSYYLPTGLIGEDNESEEPERNPFFLQHEELEKSENHHQQPPEINAPFHHQQVNTSSWGDSIISFTDNSNATYLSKQQFGDWTSWSTPKT